MKASTAAIAEAAEHIRRHRPDFAESAASGGHAAAAPSNASMSKARFPVLGVAAAVAHEGGCDLVMATELFDMLGGGWELEGDDLRRLQSTVPGIDACLHPLLLSAFRDNQREELVLGAMGMVPRHAVLIGASLAAATRLRRLSIHYAFFGDAGVTAIADALQRGDGQHLTELQLANVHMGNPGAVGLAAALRSPHCRLETIVLDGNFIGDEGALAIVDAVLAAPNKRRRVSLARNLITTTGEVPDRVAQVPACFDLRLGRQRRERPPEEESHSIRLRILTARDAEVAQHQLDAIESASTT